jgi:predicted RNase H-like nuclease (RuvC/YqgF family)
MRVARVCDSRVNEMKVQHAGALTANQTTVTRLEEENAALKAATAALEAQVAALQSQTTWSLKDLHTTVAAVHGAGATAAAAVGARACGL